MGNTKDIRIRETSHFRLLSPPCDWSVNDNSEFSKTPENICENDVWTEKLLIINKGN